MAVTVDKLGICTPVTVGTSGTTIPFTTNVVIAANTVIVIAIFGDPPATNLTGVVGGGLTWTVDKIGVSSNASAEFVALCSAVCVAGLASGTTITPTYNVATSSRMAGGMSLLGVDLSASRLDGVPPAKADMIGQPWASNSCTVAQDSVLVGASVWDQVSTNTPTSPSVESFDVSEAVGGNSLAMEYRIPGAAGSYTVAGNWDAVFAATPSTVIVVGYKVGVTGPPGVARHDWSKFPKPKLQTVRS